jgi:uncharacterized protein (DUF58 family)
MQTLTPAPAHATAHAWVAGRRVPARWLGWSLTPRALWLLLAGLLFGILALGNVRLLWSIVAWDAAVVLLAGVDLLRLPSPEALVVTRRFLEAPALGEATGIELEVRREDFPSLARGGNRRVDVRVTDALHPTLAPEPMLARVLVYARDPATVRYAVVPRARGGFALEPVYLRLRGAFGLAERWAVAEISQTVRVYPAAVRAPKDAAFYLVRARQLAQQKRRLRLRGVGREFESLRDYREGDAVRDISWTATARRGKPTVREFTTERSQQVWILLDAGRLSRATFSIRRHAGAASTEKSMATPQHYAAEHEPEQQLVTQMDLAASTALLLAQVVTGAGDKVGMMAYDRRVRQTLPPGAGALHLRILADLLSQVQSEPAEANHLLAGARMRGLQRRRGLVVWMTDLADGASGSDIATAAATLSRKHLVAVILLRHPELHMLADAYPTTPGSMFAGGAAREMLERRRATIAALESNGILVVETTGDAMAAATVTRYLEVKAAGRI